MWESSRIERRSLLKALGLAGGAVWVGGLLQACGISVPQPSPTTAPTVAAAAPTQTQPTSAAATADGAMPPAPADWQQQWDSLMANAKNEGQVAVLSQSGETYRQYFDAFGTKFGISVNLLPGAGMSDQVPRVAAERQAGQFLWDVVAQSPSTLFQGFKPMNALDPLAAQLILPKVLDDTQWLGGFAAGWADTGKTLDYDFVSYLSWEVRVNRDVLPESQLTQLSQIWTDDWKGKIAIQDPRINSAGSGVTEVWLTLLGEDKLRAFYQTQQPTVTQDRRQLAQWIIEGAYPIGIGVAPDELVQLANQGASVDQVKPLVDTNPAASQLSTASGALGIFNQPAHPNAAKLLINWMLSQEGQSLYSQTIGLNVRRLDAPVADPSSYIDPQKWDVPSLMRSTPNFGNNILD